MAKQHTKQKSGQQPAGFPLSFSACPNQNCPDFNRFNACNLSIAERMGKDKAIRRLYCKTCATRFSERQDSLMEYTKLPEAIVVLDCRCPAMVLGLTKHVWTVLEYACYPVHVSDLQRGRWVEQREDTLPSALNIYQRKKLCQHYEVLPKIQ